MSKFLFLLSLFCFYNSYCQPGFGLISAHRIGDGLGGNDVGNCIKKDALGNSYVVGSFIGKIDLDPSSADSNLTTIGLDKNIFLAKYDVNGNYLWAKNIGSTQDDEGYYLNISPGGNVTICGYFQGTVDFDPSSAVSTLTHPSGIFLAQYTSSGNYLWAKQIAAGTTLVSKCQSINSDATGNLILSGYFSSTNDFDPSPATSFLTSTGATDVFIAKYDANGNYIWAKNMGGSGNDFCYSQTLDNSGNLFITGTFSTTADFDPSTAASNLTSAGLNDIFIAKYDANGNYVWAKSIGSTNTEDGKAIVNDAAGNIYVTGNYSATVDFDPSAAVSTLTCNTFGNVYIGKYDTNGNYIWNVQAIIAPFTYNDVNCIDLDNLNNIYVGGPNYLHKYNSSGAFQTATFSYFQNISVRSIDVSTKLTSTGGFYGNASFGSGNISSFVGNSLFVADHSLAGVCNWAIASRDGQSDGFEKGTSIKRDVFNNIFVAGTYDGLAAFDPSVPANYIASDSNSVDIFIAKYDPSGNFLWVRSIGGTHADGGSVSMELDINGNIYLTGIFSQTADFDPSPAVANLVVNHVGIPALFIAKYDNSGNYLLAKSIDSPPIGSGIIGSKAITVDLNGNVYITGYYNGTIDFDPSAGVVNKTSQSGANDIFFAKYDSNGNFLWVNSMGGNLYADSGEGLKIDSNGNLLLVGEFTSTCDFDPSPTTFTISSVGGDDGFIAKYDPSGNFIWAKVISGAGSNDVIQSIELNSNNEIYLTGNISGSAFIDFDPGPGVANLFCASANPDVFVAKYDAAGNYLWANSLGGAGNDYGTYIGLDANQNIYITGYFQGNSDFDPSAASAFIQSNSGSEDIFIAKYDPQGNYLIANKIGGALSLESGTALTFDQNNNLLLTGYFRGVADFNLSPAITNLSSDGYWCDIFIAKFASCASTAAASTPTLTSVSPTICVNSNVNLMLSGSLNGAANWQWSIDSCGGQIVGSGTLISVSPTITTTYYAKGIGSCVNAGSCSSVIQTVLSCAGITTNEKQENNITVFPNPFKNIINIRSSQMKKQYVEVYNTLGSVVFKELIEGEKAEIDLSDCSPGIYFLRLASTIIKIIKE